MKKVLSSMPAQAALLLVLSCFALATLLPGCGANPSGPSTSVSTPQTPTAASGSAVVYGSVTDLETGSQVSGSGFTVSLYLDSTLVSSRSLNNGGFTFNGLSQGIYTLFVTDSTNTYSSNFQLVNVSTSGQFQTEIKLRRIATAVGIRLVNLWGKITSSDGSGIPFARVTLGTSAFETTTMIDGSYYLFNVPQSDVPYDLKVTKSGYNDKTQSLIIGAATITLNGAEKNSQITKTDQTATSRTGYDLGTAVLTGKPTTTAAITGYVKTPKGDVVPNFTFKLFHRKDLSDTSQITEQRTVISNAAGYFSETTLPKGYYFAAATNAKPKKESDGTTFIWSIDGTVYASNIEAISDTAAEAIITIANNTPGINTPALTAPANLVRYTSDQNADFSWTGVGTATSYVVRLLNPPANPTGRVYNLELPAPSTGALSQNISFFGLPIGYYNWQVGAVDVSTNQTIYSNPRSFLVAPDRNSLSPAYDQVIMPGGAASPSITLRYPSDPNASKIEVEIFDAAGNRLADPKDTEFGTDSVTYTWDGAWTNAIPEMWQWQVTYWYAGSTIKMTSERTRFYRVRNP